MIGRYWALCLLIVLATQPAYSQVKPIIPGAERTQLYFHLLKGQRVAVFANQTSMVKNTHLVDTLLNSGINVVKIFSPEHGFRGDADAGAELANSTDKKTGVLIISLYGNHNKPTADELKDVDVMLFDIQDVGVRFYTYISSLQYYMEAAIENNKPLIILDRPNPNGFYVDGPVLDTAYKSFIGMQPIPVVYGMTMGEYAEMLLREHWLSVRPKYDFFSIDSAFNKWVYLQQELPLQDFILRVITCQNYDHNSKYSLPVNPSPNLKEMQAIYLYPSTCFFEGTVLSEGRGTDKPFELFGHPSLPDTLFAFTPKPNAGSKSSKCFYQQCYGWNLSANKDSLLQQLDCKIQLKYLLDAYKLFPGKDSFFLKNNFFNKLAGNAILMQQIKDGKTEAEIRKSWEPELVKFKAIRKKYLLYKDFE
jgi:uncharacterized protein YbbC (DUF1343 family)